MNRYGRSSTIAGGQGLSTNQMIALVRKLKDRGDIPTRQHVMKEGERLDHLAAKTYGSSQLWWVIAVCSDIGWSLQVPPGTVVNLPVSLGSIAGIVS